MASPKKTIAIIGAGPAGLVAARTFLRSGRFDITIFEKSSEVGGLWSMGAYIDPDMSTNLNRFTVSFSGLSWDSIDLGREGLPPMFPKASMVRKYLHEYQRRYVPTSLVRLETLVTNASFVAHEESDTANKTWRITTRSTSDNHVEPREYNFDYLVVTTGPFSKPKGFRTSTTVDTLQNTRVPIIHSTKYRTLKDVLPGNEQTTAGKLLVVGGSHSGSEVATKMALELFSPSNTPSLEIVHLTSRRLFALSPLLPTGKGDFEPADFKLYNRSNHPEPSPNFSYGLLNATKHRAIVEMIQGLIGESDSPPKHHAGEELQLSAVISETYSQMTRSGLIKPVQGALVDFEAPTDMTFDRLTAIIRSSSGERSIVQDILGVVHATGFDTAASLAFLSQDVKALLDYDVECDQYPVVLDTSYISQNTKVPSLAIIGFAAQYWGVMEMQARAVISAWGSDIIYPAKEERHKICTFYDHL